MGPLGLRRQVGADGKEEATTNASMPFLGSGKTCFAVRLYSNIASFSPWSSAQKVLRELKSL